MTWRCGKMKKIPAVLLTVAFALLLTACGKAEQFTESLAQCAGMKKLTAMILNSLIEKIEVHNPVMVNGVKEQKLTVYYIKYL